MSTSWCTVLSALETAFATGSTVGMVSKGDKQISYKTTADLIQAIDYAARKCAAEQGTYTRRTYARNVGPGDY